MTARDKITYAVPTHTWMTLPGTVVQVRHEDDWPVSRRCVKAAVPQHDDHEWEVST